MKKLFILLLLLTVSLHAMEENPQVQRMTVGNCTNYFLTPQKMPEIKIQECMGCGKEASTRCGNCKFTYYCSEGCQKSNWSNHKSKCKEIKQAQFGDIAQMRNLYAAFMNKASKTTNKKFVKEGLSWHLRTLIRLRQDVSCSKDNSTQSSIERVQLDHGQLMKQLTEKNICSQKELEDISKEIFKDAIAWVENKTKEKHLVPPFGIRRYGLSVFMNPEMHVDEEFVPENEWYNKRMDVLRQYQQAFANRE